MSEAPLRVLLAASEIFPLAKTGGLADASAALAAALARLGVEVHLVMPAYAPALDLVRELGPPAELPKINGLMGGLLLTGKTPDSGLPISLVDFPTLYRDGGGLYVDAEGKDRPNNPERFAALSHAACLLALGELSLPRFDIVHCNDWHTGLIPLLLQARAGQAAPVSVFTIHNMAFQGQCPLERLPALGVHLDGEELGRVEYYGQASFLKAGLEFADEVTTVSPRYAEEIQTAEFGFGLEGVVRARSDHLTGILNGIDRSIWSPAVSPWLARRYGPDSLDDKRACKRELQRELGLTPDPGAPLMVFIGRLTWQKMADVLLEVVPRYLEAEPDRQFVLLGTGDLTLEDGFRDLAEKHPGRVAILIGYTEDLAHRLHGGGDVLIHGSRFEPCGLTQLYAMQFGTIPVVRPVGGLADTVVDVRPETLAADTATGFYFSEASVDGMLAGIDRAIDMYRQPEPWRRLQRAAMRQSFSWEDSAHAYLSVYRRGSRP